jgi:hypothetical protein
VESCKRFGNQGGQLADRGAQAATGGDGGIRRRRRRRRHRPQLQQISEGCISVGGTAARPSLGKETSTRNTEREREREE